MKIRSILFILFSLALTAVTAQEKWDLKKCVDYALANNISVRQADLQSRFSALTLKQDQAAQLPTLNLSSSAGYRLGRTENPTTGVLEDQNFRSLNVQLQSQVTLFNWFSLKRTIEASRLNLEAEQEQTKKVQNDVALNVAVAYLQVLLAQEQANLARVQVSQSKAQLDMTRKRVDAGALPELNAAELEAQLGRDSSALVAAEGSVRQFILQLKALLNLDAAAPFAIETPPIELIPVEPLADLMPEAVYASALTSLPQQKVNKLRLQSARKSVAAARAGMFPTISAFGSLATNAIGYKLPEYERITSYSTAAGLRVDVGGTFYPIEVPTVTFGNNIVGYSRAGALGTQLNNNFGQNIGIGLSIPILNGRRLRTAWEWSKLQVRQYELTQEQDSMKLKQDIYLAYNDAVTAMQKFNANKKTVEISEKAYGYSQKRYELALLSSFELVTSQNNLQRAKIDMLYAQYDYVFKMKLLEFYKGQGLKL